MVKLAQRVKKKFPKNREKEEFGGKKIPIILDKTLSR